MNTATADETRFCEHCVTYKALADFRRRSRNGTSRLNQCRTCHNEAERERRAAKRARREDRRISKALTKVKNEPRPDRFEFLCGVMIERFGGVKGFVGAWAQHLEQAKPGSRTAVRSFEMIARLIEHHSKQQPAVEDMTAEQLARELTETVAEMVQQHPEIAVAPLEEAGWTVIPPGSP